MERRVLLVGSTPQTARVARKRARVDQGALRLRAQKLKVQNAEIMARERADDREVERLKIEERRRWREEKQDERRRVREEKQSMESMAESIKRVADQLEASKKEVAEREKNESSLVNEVAQFLASIDAK